jgi:hypothetical protein
MNHTTPPAHVRLLLLIHVLLLHAVPTAWVTRRLQARTEERGDVPGWVLITVMTAGLVAGLWAIAGPALEGMLRQALDSVR